MAKERDYRAEYRRRVERARERGLSAAQGYGKAARSKARPAPSISELRATGRLSGGVRRLGGGGQRREGPAGSTISTSTDAGDIRRSIERARRAGHNVVIRWTAATEKGPRTITIDGRGGKQLPPLTAGGKPLGAVTVTELPRGHQGASAGELASFFDDAEPWWEWWWADVIEVEYEEGEYS